MNMEDALCAQIGTDLFFPEINIPQTRVAKSICMDCPLTIDCLKTALAIPGVDDHGVWGATTAKDRAIMRKDPNRLHEFIEYVTREKANNLSNVA